MDYISEMVANLLFDRSDRVRLHFSGPQAAATLNGLVTNDVAALHPGTGQYAAVLSAKGKIIADVRIFMQHDGILLDTSAAAAPGLLDFFRKYVNPRFAKQTDLTDRMTDLGVFGVDASTIVTHAFALSPEIVTALAPYATTEGRFNDTPVTIAQVPDLGIAGYEVFAPKALQQDVWHTLVQGGAIPAAPTDWDARRITIGWPAWGIDMDDTTLPQEANFDALQGISYTKGCYIGQEIVARIHFRGHVNKYLRRLAFEGQLPPPTGADLIDDTGKPVGEVRSVAHTEHAGIIGLGMVRREVPDGAILTARWNQGTSTREVRVLGKAKGAID